MERRFHLASDEAIKKMMQAILEKRQKLGLLDWGMVPIEDVLSRLNKKENPSAKSEKGLEKNRPKKQNDIR